MESHFGKVLKRRLTPYNLRGFNMPGTMHYAYFSGGFPGNAPGSAALASRISSLRF